MNFLELVKSRYSVRSFQERNVEPEKLAYLLECARLAPSACNRQPWRLIVVREKALREAVCDAAARFVWMREAPLLVVVCVDESEAWVRGADSRNHADVDAAIVTEHLVLAAAEQGLGSCWVCAFDPTKCRAALSIEEPLRPVAILPIGYPADEHQTRPRKTTNEIVTQR